MMKLNFGDTVYCDIEYNGITGVKERVTECTWLPTLGKYKNIVLGNEIKSYTDSVNTAVNQITKNWKLKAKICKCNSECYPMDNRNKRWLCSFRALKMLQKKF